MPFTVPPQRVIDHARSHFGFAFWNRWIAALLAGLGPAAFDAQFTSWFRDQVENQRVGGVPGSQHRDALAIDFVLPTFKKTAAIDRLRAQGFTVLDEPTHVHVQTFTASVWRQILGSGAF